MKRFLLTSAFALAIAGSGCDADEVPQTAVTNIEPENGTDTGEQFALTHDGRRALERKAEQGDGAAAFQISQHFGMAGGDSGRAGDPENGVNEDRWLKRAAALGFEPAKLSWAVKTGRRDCTAARQMLAELIENSSNAAIRKSAQAWAGDDYLCRQAS
ncbi:MAG: hypothetical protein JHD35_12380 [Sphingopyxis sp.]|nr:hypothetical protein [Sphingopyxis sp.]